MAEQCRTVRVSGLPTDMQEDRLTDKLYIYFLRARNGGGEIASVIIVKATPGSALITFEDIGVTRSVLQHGRHILKVDGKNYELTLSEPHKDLDPNKVILSMSVTVDYSQLPGGKAALTCLDRSHDVQIHYNNPEQLCTMQGLYSQVQAALAQILGLPGALASTDTPPPGANGVLGVLTRGTRGQAKRTHTQEVTDHHRRGDEQSDLGSGPHRDFTSGGQGWEGEGTAQAEGGAVGLCLSEEPPMVEEDLSLIMDADMFHYLQRHCGGEYQEILTQHGVEVVDVTAEGVTTLFLQRVPGVGDIGQELERLSGARGDLSRLYQENEARLRRARLPKSVLSPSGGLSRAMEGLQVRLPKLLLSEDDRNVYIVGNSSDVSEAKQFLLLGEREEAVEDVASLLRSPSSTSGSSKPGEEERLTPTLSSTAGTALDARLDKLLKEYETERRTEGARGYKFAPCFKALGPAGLGTRRRDTGMVGDTSPSVRPGLGPMLGLDLFGSDRAGSGAGGLYRPGTQGSGEDILFKRGDPLFTPSSMENGLFLRSSPTDLGQQGETAPFTTTLNTLSGGTTVSTSGSGSTLKRASSFSGRARSKVQDPGQSEAEKATTRATRSNSLDRRNAYSAELTISMVIWNYMKEAYATRIQDMTSDLQMRESQSDKSSDITVILRGADLSVVRTCQLEMQKLVATVKTDFCLQELRLAELGVSDPADETLEVCCAEVRQRFKKVSIQTMRESVFLIGPKQLCSQVGSALREVFPGEIGQRGGQEDFSVPSTSTLNQSSPFQVNGVQNSTQFQSNSPQRMSETQRGGEEGHGANREKKNIQRSDSSKRTRNSESEHKNTVVSQSPARKDPVLKEKVERGGTMEVDGSKTDTFLSHSAIGNGGRPGAVNGGGTNQDMVTPPKESNLRSRVTQNDNNRQSSGAENQERPGSGGALTRHGPGRSSLSGARTQICVCGENGASVTRTGCGVTLCPQCLLKVHVQCRVCPKAEVAVPQGIQGSMSYSEMPFSLPGHGRDVVVKITYCIPDGIQGESHPSPGSAFRGGVFEAYLPLCERTRKLLPRLEKAFRLGLTFTVTGREPGARVSWDSIPHKTSLQGGKSGNGYPDSTYLSRLSEVLRAHGIEEAAAKSQDTNKT
uniref:RING-type E3 ubiquitin transferase n=1 Tax=Hucho hucho TaxID=62062 RepID=A0A4W5QT00_9TELE